MSRAVQLATVAAAALLFSRCLAAQTSADGPFGLHMGMTKAELARTLRLEPMQAPLAYSTSNVPRPHAAFETYVLTISDDLGLCRVSAIGKTIETSSYGTELSSAFHQMEEALTHKYGVHKTNDFLRSGSIWNEPNEWMMALYKKERYLTAFWDSEERSTLPTSLASIMLDSKALGPGRGYLTLHYDFANIDRCVEQQKALKNDAL